MEPSKYYVRILYKNNFENFIKIGSGILINNTTVISCYHVINQENVRKSPNFYIELPNSNFSFPIEIKVYQQPYEKIDLVIFKIDTSLNYLEYPITFLKSGYSKLITEPCAVYINKSPRLYGWTKAKIEHKSSDYLIQSTITEKPIPVDNGHSGSAVWYHNQGTNLAIGMVKNANGKDRFDFISGEEIIPCLQGINLINLNIKKLDLSSFYIRLKRHYNPSIEFIKGYHRLNKTLVIYGISGIGKTSLAIDLVKNNSTNFDWIDCRLVHDKAILFDSIKELKQNDYVVLDNLYKNHDFFAKDWLEEVPHGINFIITTSCTICREKIKNWNNRTKKFLLETVELNGFNYEEGIDFLKPIDTKYVDLPLKETIVKIAKGVPLILSFIMDIIINDIDKKHDEYNSFESNQYLFQILNSDISEENIINIVIKKWFNHSDISQTQKEVLYIISSISNIGMTLPCISHIIARDKVQTKNALESLRNKGFISLKVDPENDERLIVAHDLIKKITKQITEFKKEYFEESFFKYIKSKGSQKECGIVTRIDSLILKMKNIWEKSNSNITGNRSSDFMVQLENYSKELNLLLPNNAGSPEKSKWIAELFDPLTSEDCTILIPLARVIFKLNANELLAELVWSALNKNIENDEKESFMARANLICSAFSHWRRIPQIQKCNILQKSKDHLINLEIHQILKNVNEPDLEASMIIGGLCSIGLIDEAIEIVSNGKFAQFSNEMDLSYLMILASLLDGYTTQENKQKVERFMNSKLPYTTENEAKDDMIAFLEHKGYDIDKSQFKNKKEFYYNSNKDRMRGLSMAVAKMTNSQDFRSFVINQRKNGVEVWV